MAAMLKFQAAATQIAGRLGKKSYLIVIFILQ